MKKEKDEWDQLTKACPYIKEFNVKVGSCSCRNCKHHLENYNSNAEYVAMTAFTCVMGV